MQAANVWVRQIALCALLGVAGVAVGGPGPTAKAPNPHWRSDGCGHCHQVVEGRPRPIAADALDAVCLACHDGNRAVAEIHPIGHTLAGGRFTKPAAWPLVNDRLGCVTCHDVRRACLKAAERPETNPIFLRGPRAPQAFCQKCHPSQPYRRYNPHLMLTPQGSYRVEACRFCHLPIVRNKRLTLCRGCHGAHVDWFQPGHIGATISPDRQAYMVAREKTGPTTRPSRDLIAKFKAAGTEPVRTRPDPEGKLVCTTCHNPHAKGVFRAGHRLDHRAMKHVGPEKVVSPVRSRRFCQTCHNK